MSSVGFSLDSYDGIGFDLDCTIAEYNVKNLFKLVYDLLVKFLIEEKHYDWEFFRKPFQESEFFLQKGLFMDLKKGNVLKINGKGTIVKATHGTRVLTDEEIIQLYGPNKTFGIFKDFVQDPLCIINTPYEKMLRSMLDCFDMPCTLLFARIVDNLDERNNGPSCEYNIWPDILSGLYYLYKRDHFATGESEFFSQLRSNPGLYYKKWSQEKLNWLKELKGKKVVFLVTGSFIDFATVTASYCLGENWKEYFDIAVYYARKPFFFSADHPYMRVEGDKEKEAVPGEHLRADGVYSQGNWQQLKAFISKQANVAEPKCLYVGDNLIQDVYAPDHFHCCDTVAVSSELKEDLKLCELWGSYFEGRQGETSYWNHLIKSHAKICVSGLDVFVRRPLNFPYHLINLHNSSDRDETNGYYAA